MPKSPIRILAYALLVALCAIAHPALAQVAPRMTIDSIPPGANVFIDGALQGQSGPNFKVRIPKGQHKLVLELEGHKRFEQQISVSVAQKLTFPLEKAPARLDIKFPATNDAAKGGEVFVDGAPAGVVPVPAPVPKKLLVAPSVAARAKPVVAKANEVTTRRNLIRVRFMKGFSSRGFYGNQCNAGCPWLLG